MGRLIASLLLITSLTILTKESNKKNRAIFLNFVIFFFAVILQGAVDFIGSAFFRGEEFKYANFLSWEFTTIAYILFLSAAIVYLVIDLLFHNMKRYQKYLATYTIVLAFFGFHFYPFVLNPFYLYSTEDIKQWKSLDDYLEGTHTEAVKTDGNIPTAVELATSVKLQSWSNGQPIGDLYPRENIKRIEELMPYLEADNWKVLFCKPIFLKIIYMNVLLIGFIILFFGYQYKKDPPQGAYIDKIMFLFLLFCSMEIVHNWGFIKSIEWTSVSEMFGIGQYVTLVIELLMVLFFSLRLKFITSVQGEFYETELASNPQQVSRWRDWVDNIVLAKFFNFKIFNGRLFQNPSSK